LCACVFSVPDGGSILSLATMNPNQKPASVVSVYDRRVESAGYSRLRLARTGLIATRVYVGIIGWMGVVFMRNFAVTLLLVFAGLGSAGYGASKSKVSELPAGAMSGNTYVNDAVGVSYQFPVQWNASPDPKGETRIHPKPDVPANRCSKILLRLEAPAKTEGKFTSVAALLAVDPECLSGGTFPQSVEEKDKIEKVAKRTTKAFADTPFISPFHTDVYPFTLQGRVVIQLTGALIINANAVENHAAPKEPLRINTSFTLTESNGYWIAWVYTADDPSAEELKKATVVFK
jgi:hypothetical protein